MLFLWIGSQNDRVFCLEVAIGPLSAQTGKRGSCRRDIVRVKEFFRRDTRDKTLARDVHA